MTSQWTQNDWTQPRDITNSHPLGRVPCWRSRPVQYQMTLFSSSITTQSGIVSSIRLTAPCLNLTSTPENNELRRLTTVYKLFLVSLYQRLLLLFIKYNLALFIPSLDSSQMSGSLVALQSPLIACCANTFRSVLFKFNKMCIYWLSKFN